MAGLRSANKIERLSAVQSLIDRRVRRRPLMMRLSPAEQAEWTARIEIGRKQGMAALQSDERRYGDKKCAVCEGAAGTCATRPKRSQEPKRSPFQATGVQRKTGQVHFHAIYRSRFAVEDRGGAASIIGPVPFLGPPHQ